MSDIQICPTILRHMPSDRREGWRLIFRGLVNAGNEARSIRAAQWIEENGRQRGLRRPTAAE
eukprot:4813600-Alexandrium_andersonii.AAC.1